MARTKRKTNPVAPLAAEALAKEVQNAIQYLVGGYARLSVVDSGKPGSETLENQKTMILDYISRCPDMKLVSLFFDNGETGTDFNRPGFEGLMQAVRKGEVNCVVVKDLSRFGRNYKETGNYLERIFPFLGVRFIAITDNFDTLTAERSANGYIIPLKNLINETYSKDISQKISGALHTKQQRGEFIGAWAPYGYSKDPADKHKLIPNPATAPVVRRIFQMRFEGASYQTIVRTLNTENISSPSRYLVEAGICKNETYAHSIWKIMNVKNILKRQVYIGHMVQGVKRQSFYDGRSVYYLPKDEWEVVPNTHQAIIDIAVFAKVQEMEQERHNAYYENLGKFDHLGKTENILQGFIFCAECGRPLVRYKNVSHGKKMWYTFICQTHSNDNHACTLKNIREDDLLSILQEAISKQIALAIDMATLTESVNNTSESRKKVLTMREQLEKERKSLNRCEALHDSLYQSYVEKLMSECEYIAMKDRYAMEIETHKANISEIERQMEASKVYTPENQFLAAFSAFKGNVEVSREILAALISRVEIGVGNLVTIKFRYQSEFEQLNEYLRLEASSDEYTDKVSSHF